MIERLAEDLRLAFPEMKGFSPRNLKYMRAFALAWPDEAIVQEALAQLPWYHHLALLDKLPDPETRRWYAAKAIEHNWSRNILVMQIETRLLERSGQAVSNFRMTLPKPQSDLARESLKDLYRFDFLGLHVMKLPEAKRDVVLLPRRWVVERSFGRAVRFRCLARDDEKLPQTLARPHYIVDAAAPV